MNYPLISVIVCTYNRKQFLSETLESIFRQHYTPIEIIIIDDGSNDGTEELVNEYHDRVSYHRQENQGITAARNFGCRLAKGELITFQDDDDPMHPDKLVTLMRVLQKFPQAVFAVGDLAIIDNHSQMTGERWVARQDNIYQGVTLIKDAHTAVLWPTVPATPNTTLFKRNEAEQIDWFDPGFNVGSEDKDFYARLALKAPIVYVPEIVTYYRRGHSSMTGKASLIAASQISLFIKHMALIDCDSTPLIPRLQTRLLSALRTYIKYHHVDAQHKIIEHQNYIKLAMSKLSTQQKLNFYFYRYIQVPLNKLIKKEVNSI